MNLTLHGISIKVETLHASAYLLTFFAVKKRKPQEMEPFSIFQNEALPIFPDVEVAEHVAADERQFNCQISFVVSTCHVFARQKANNKPDNLPTVWF